MELDIFQIDAFANRSFSGNPAAVIPLTAWLDDDVMQAIAEENNLSETVYFVPEEDGYRIRWFTPKAEVNLCGHATLASAYHLFQCDPTLKNIRFYSASGPLNVSRRDHLIRIDFPANPATACATPSRLVDALGAEPNDCLQTADKRRFLAIFSDPQQVLNASPNMSLLATLEATGVLISSPGHRSEYDFIQRFFAPKIGVPEDPVTGSAFTNSTPYWAEHLGKSTLSARQVSPRGGDVLCELIKDRVYMTGQARYFIKGTVYL